MVQTSRGVGGSDGGGSVSGLRDLFGTRDRRATLSTLGGGATDGAYPNGPRGRRMLAADTPLDQLDRTAPRGTYLDILV